MRKPPFAGDSEIGQIFSIFAKLGSPNEEIWPGVTKLRDFKPIFPKFKPSDFLDNPNPANVMAFDLIKKMLVFNPAKRIHAEAALRHPYFKTLDEEVLKIYKKD